MTDQWAFVIAAAIAAVPPTAAILISTHSQTKTMKENTEVVVQAATGPDSTAAKIAASTHELVNSKMAEQVAARQAAEDKVKLLEALLIAKGISKEGPC